MSTIRLRLGTQCARRQPWLRAFSDSTKLHSADQSKLPRIANPAFWSQLIPRAFRSASDEDSARNRAKIRAAGDQERRTAIAFLVLGLIVGSNAINLISLKRDMLNFSRQTDARLGLLREVVQKVKDGETVDVKKALGTGDPEAEKEWEQVIKELGTTDMLLEGRRNREKRSDTASSSGIGGKKVADQAGRQVDADDGAATSQGANEVRRPKFLM